MSRNQIQDFRVLPIKFSKKNTAYHELFIKEHNVRNQLKEHPKGCTLFVLNVPPYATEKSLNRLFSVAGEIENVTFQRKYSITQPRCKNAPGFKIGYIVFKKPKGLLNSLKLTTLEPLSNEVNPILHGVDKWIQEYNMDIPDVKQMQTQINTFMSEFDKKLADEKKKELTAGEEDEDGWTTVTKQGRKPGLSRKEIVEKRLKNKIEQSKKKKELKNFYTFQIRESKMKHLASLRQKFEEDKKKINALKQARKFKPF